jgi:hypothetical protein
LQVAGTEPVYMKSKAKTERGKETSWNLNNS